MSVADTEVARPESVGRKVFSWTVYPLLQLMVLGPLVMLIKEGRSVATLGGVIMGLSALAAIVVMVLEFVQPHARIWRPTFQELRTDFLHTVFSSTVAPELFNVLFRSALLAGGAWVATVVGFEVWPGGWPLIVQVPMALLIGEFFQYWFHRSAHSFEILWRFHSVHHSSRRLYWLASSRFHPLEEFVAAGVQLVPLLLLGCPAEVLIIYGMFVSTNGLVQHGNVEVRLGVLNYILATPDLHRWHHSRSADDSNNNYGGWFIVWDIVFGTRHLPGDHQPEDCGLGDMPHYPRGYLGHLAAPFRWKKLTDESEPSP